MQQGHASQEMGRHDPAVLTPQTDLDNPDGSVHAAQYR